MKQQGRVIGDLEGREGRKKVIGDQWGAREGRFAWQNRCARTAQRAVPTMESS